MKIKGVQIGLAVLVVAAVAFAGIYFAPAGGPAARDGRKEPGKKASARKAGSGVRFKNAGGEVVIDSKSGRLGDDWPADLPPYPNAKVKSSVRGVGDTRMKIVILKTGDSTSAVSGFYEKLFVKRGWTVENRLKQAGDDVVMVSKGARGASVSVAKDTDSDNTVISISVAFKPGYPVKPAAASTPTP